jgi:exosortase A-associated hydrolase 1
MTSSNEDPIVFDCEGEQLVGILHQGANPGARLGVLIVVGGPQYRVGSHRQFVLMARDLAASGYPVFRFDYRGMGDGEGEPRTFESVDDDLQAAIAAFERAVPGLSGLVLWGLCDAASAIMMCATPPSVRGKIVVNPWVRTSVSEARAYVRHYYLRRVLQRDFWRKLRAGAMDVREAAQQFIQALRRAAVRTAKTQGFAASYIDRMLAGTRKFHGAVLVLLSGRDLTAREFEALHKSSPDWRRAMRLPAVRFVRIENADHTFSDRRILDTATRATIDWLGGLSTMQE